MGAKMKVPALTAALLLSSAVSAAGQSLVVTTKTPLKVAASYGYSQVHHAGKWIRVDVAVQSERRETMRLHKAFSLLTPDGERIDLPSQPEYRAGFSEINAMKARAANLQLPAWLAIPQCKPKHFAGWNDISLAHSPRGDPCRTWRLWGNGGVDWAVSIGPSLTGGASLYFHSPDGWAAGEYWLEVDGPGDLDARLPVRLH